MSDETPVLREMRLDHDLNERLTHTKVDPAFRQMSEGLRREVVDLIANPGRMGLSCCIEGCCVSWCCIRIT